MIVHDGYEDLKLLNPVVTLGSFDGVHRGHQELISRLMKTAGRISGESVIITFYPHPRIVLSDNKTGLVFLTTPAEKISLLEKEGVDHLIVIPFDHELSNKEACEFIEEVLVKKIGIKILIAGFNQHFGRRGDSDFETIRRCAESFDISVEQVPALSSGKAVISSSLIRDALLKGELDKANGLLGYNYFLNGTVVEGKRLGRELGYPTANISPDYANKLIPKAGVYAVEVKIKGTRYRGMMSIGFNPTVNEDITKQTLEVNIFDFEKEIYGSSICIVFRKRMRDEIKFANVSQLVSQLGLDKISALNLLKE